MIFASLFVFGVSLLGVCEGYGSGAPASACGHMTPGHLYDGNATLPISPQEDASPFSISVSKETYGSGEELSVTLTGTTSFIGFFIQGRPAGQDKPVGTFSDFEQERMKTVSECSDDYPAAAITHTNQHPTAVPWENTFTVQWTAPEESVGNITFYATVAQDHDNFWVKIPSESISYSGFAHLTPTIVMLLLPIAQAVARVM